MNGFTCKICGEEEITNRGREHFRIGMGYANFEFDICDRCMRQIQQQSNRRFAEEQLESIAYHQQRDEL